MKIAFNCICGARWAGNVPNNIVEKIRKVWNENHSGLGHAQCNIKTASRKRCKKDEDN